MLAVLSDSGSVYSLLPVVTEPGYRTAHQVASHFDPG